MSPFSERFRWVFNFFCPMASRVVPFPGGDTGGGNPAEPRNDAGGLYCCVIHVPAIPMMPPGGHPDALALTVAEFHAARLFAAVLNGVAERDHDGSLDPDDSPLQWSASPRLGVLSVNFAFGNTAESAASSTASSYVGLKRTRNRKCNDLVRRVLDRAAARRVFPGLDMRSIHHLIVNPDDVMESNVPCHTARRDGSTSSAVLVFVWHAGGRVGPDHPSPAMPMTTASGEPLAMMTTRPSSVPSASNNSHFAEDDVPPQLSEWLRLRGIALLSHAGEQRPLPLPLVPCDVAPILPSAIAAGRRQRYRVGVGQRSLAIACAMMSSYQGSTLPAARPTPTSGHTGASRPIAAASRREDSHHHGSSSGFLRGVPVAYLTRGIRLTAIAVAADIEFTYVAFPHAGGRLVVCGRVPTPYAMLSRWQPSSSATSAAEPSPPLFLPPMQNAAAGSSFGKRSRVGETGVENCVCLVGAPPFVDVSGSGSRVIAPDQLRAFFQYRLPATSHPPRGTETTNPVRWLTSM